MSFVYPKVFMIGFPSIDSKQLIEYLKYTDQEGFLNDVQDAEDKGISAGEILCSYYAKLCYKSLVIGKNDNISEKRDIESNFKGILATAHGSVLEHANINFICTNCSRVLTHELVRHRAGTAFSQTSGRYCRGDKIDFIADPILAPINEYTEVILHDLQQDYKFMCDRMGLNGWDKLEAALKVELNRLPMTEEVEKAGYAVGLTDGSDKLPMALKKKVTSALRRILPNGQANEIGFTMNMRTLRHFVMVRSSRHAEVEIRCMAEQVYKLVKAKFPLIFSDAKEEMIENYLEITGMRMQPYEN